MLGLGAGEMANSIANDVGMMTTAASIAEALLGRIVATGALQAAGPPAALGCRSRRNID
jgi:predicted N-formylglutamate amidohydrolase